MKKQSLITEEVVAEFMKAYKARESFGFYPLKSR